VIACDWKRSPRYEWSFVPNCCRLPSTEAKVARLAMLAAHLDGVRPGQWEDDLAEFNRLAGTPIPLEEFQGIYGGEDHQDWADHASRGRLFQEEAPLATASGTSSQTGKDNRFSNPQRRRSTNLVSGPVTGFSAIWMAAALRPATARLRASRPPLGSTDHRRRGGGAPARPAYRTCRRRGER